MAEYFLRLLILLPVMGGLIWGSLWLWKRAQVGGLTRHQSDNRPIKIVDVLTMGTSGRLAVIDFDGRRLLVSASRHGLALLSESAGARPDA